MLTFDYELFFGTHSGSVQKCLLQPTERLLSLARKYGATYTFFVDCGYLIKAEEYAPFHPEIRDDLDKVKTQIKQILTEGHAIGLHVHPHWEKSYYADGRWQMVTEGAYKLADFSDRDVEDILTRYKSYLDQLTGQRSTVFRAGGWCIQPFDRFHKIFKSLGIKIDSSVIPGAKFLAGEYSYDFSQAPNQACYPFEEDVCIEKKEAFFTEYPIASMRYSPIFYWELYILGRLFPKRHKMIGDGQFLAQPGRKWSSLTSYTTTHVSTDGYYASQLEKSARKHSKRGYNSMVIIGHPKCMTAFSFQRFEQFLASMSKKHTIVSLTESI